MAMNGHFSIIVDNKSIQTMRTRFLNCVNSVNSVVLRETSLTISDLTGKPGPIPFTCSRTVHCVLEHCSEMLERNISAQFYCSFLHGVQIFEVF